MVRTWSEQIWWPSPREPQWIMTQTCDKDSPNASSGRGVVDLVHHLDLEEVVARSEASHLAQPSRVGSLAHLGRVRPTQAAAVFAPGQVVLGAESRRERGTNAFAQHRVEMTVVLEVPHASTDQAPSGLRHRGRP